MHALSAEDRKDLKAWRTSPRRISVKRLGKYILERSDYRPVEGTITLTNGTESVAGVFTANPRLGGGALTGNAPPPYEVEMEMSLYSQPGHPNYGLLER
jgi:hypothetical protein